MHRHFSLALRVEASFVGYSLPHIKLPSIPTTLISILSLNYKVVSPNPSPDSLKLSSGD